MSSKLWRYKVGPHGATVTAMEKTSGGDVTLRVYDPEANGYKHRNLGFAIRDAEGKKIPEAVDRAKKAAAKLSNKLVEGEAVPKKATVKRCVKLFKREVLPDVGERRKRGLKRDLECIQTFLGKSFLLANLSPREWNGLKRQRKSGEIDARGKKVPAEAPCPECSESQDPENCERCDGTGRIDPRQPVSDRTVQKVLKTLRQLCRFGTEYRTRTGGFLLENDPTRGLDLPTVENPSRPIITDGEYEAMLQVADEVHPYLRTLLVLAGETGRRIGAIVALRFGDWLPDVGLYGAIRWRPEEDKLGKEWVVAVTPVVQEEMERVLQERPGVGDAYLFSAPKSEGHIDVTLASRWWRKCEDLAEEVEHQDRGGWHMLRRRWATKRKDLSLKDVAHAGGWKGTQVLQDVYQQEDFDSTQEVVLADRPLTRRA